MRTVRKSPKIAIEMLAMAFACSVGLLLLAIGAVATPLDNTVTTSQISISAAAPLTGTTPPP